MQKHRSSLNRGMTNFHLSTRNKICETVDLYLRKKFAMHDCDYYECDTFAQDTGESTTMSPAAKQAGVDLDDLKNPEVDAGACINAAYSTIFDEEKHGGVSPEINYPSPSNLSCKT